MYYFVNTSRCGCAIIKNRFSNINVQVIYTHWNYIPQAFGISGTLPVAPSLGSFSWYSVPHIPFLKRRIIVGHTLKNCVLQINLIGFIVHLTCFINLGKSAEEFKSSLTVLSVIVNYHLYCLCCTVGILCKRSNIVSGNSSLHFNVFPRTNTSIILSLIWVSSLLFFLVWSVLLFWLQVLST